MTARRSTRSRSKMPKVRSRSTPTRRGWRDSIGDATSIFALVIAVASVLGIGLVGVRWVLAADAIHKRTIPEINEALDRTQKSLETIAGKLEAEEVDRKARREEQRKAEEQQRAWCRAGILRDDALCARLGAPRGGTP